MNNRMYNCKNPNQGDSKKVLCVCSAGLLRSPTCAIVLHREFGYNTRAVGIDVDHALIPIDRVLCTWADEIVCMTANQKLYIEKFIKSDTKIICLEIEDNFEYMNPQLQELILKNYKESTV